MKSFVRKLESTHAETLETIALVDGHNADAAVSELDCMVLDVLGW